MNNACFAPPFLQGLLDKSWCKCVISALVCRAAGANGAEGANGAPGMPGAPVSLQMRVSCRFCMYVCPYRDTCDARICICTLPLTTGGKLTMCRGPMVRTVRTVRMERRECMVCRGLTVSTVLRGTTRDVIITACGFSATVIAREQPMRSDLCECEGSLLTPWTEATRAFCNKAFCFAI